MKKSDQKLLQARLKSLAKPSTTLEPKPDSTDEISTIYGGQVQLPSSPLPADEPLTAQNTRDGGTNTTTEKFGTTRKFGSTNKTSTIRKFGNTGKTGKAPLPIAPERDFQRVPNSVTREAMASRLFKGKSKQVWDYLWSVSRGAITPSRTVRKSRPQIKTGAGLGSMGTVDAALEHLQTVGLVSIKTIVGENIGNEYEVFTPEEVATSIFGTTNLTGTTSTTNETGCTQNLVLPVLPDSGSTGSTLSSNISTTSEGSNTSFNTSVTNDDDATRFFEVFEALRKAEKELTGKLSKPEPWGELFELLVAELRMAATRTTVSSVPAFLTEHLRRRLWKMDKKQMNVEEKSVSSDERPTVSGEQAKSCQECGGTGFYYPKGFEGGVAKCKHEQLTQKR
jgi:hypothetical protein